MRTTRWPNIVALAAVRVARHPDASCSPRSRIANENFLSPLNVSNMMAFLPELGIIALGMTLLLTAGEFDLSVGAVFALAPVVVMLLVQNGRLGSGLALARRAGDLHRHRLRSTG